MRQLCSSFSAISDKSVSPTGSWNISLHRLTWLSYFVRFSTVVRSTYVLRWSWLWHLCLHVSGFNRFILRLMCWLCCFAWSVVLNIIMPRSLGYRSWQSEGTGYRDGFFRVQCFRCSDFIFIMLVSDNTVVLNIIMVSSLGYRFWQSGGTALDGFFRVQCFRCRDFIFIMLVSDTTVVLNIMMLSSLGYLSC